MTIEKAYRFLDHLSEAEILASEKEWVLRSAFSILSDAREVLFAHPDAQITFRAVPVPEKARLVFGIGINEAAWKKQGDGVLFEIDLAAADGTQRSVYSRYIDPKNVPADRRWFDECIDLGFYRGQTVAVSFKTTAGPKNDLTFDWAGWSEPRIVFDATVRVRKPKHTNVMLISIDTLRHDHLGCCGYPGAISAAIDRLAKQGVLFRNAVAQATVTLPSHMSILTSLYPEVHTVNPAGKFSEVTTSLPHNRVTMAELLKRQQYHTAAYVDGGWLSRKFGYDHGFDVYDDAGGRIATIGKKVEGFLKDHFPEKFFLFMHVYDVHGPYEPPARFRRLYYRGNEYDPANHSMDEVRQIGYHEYHKFGAIRDIEYVRALYAAGVTYVDQALQRIFALMEELDIFDRTLIVFLSDHGESLFERGVYIGHGMFLYDTEARIPLIIKLPAGKAGGRVVDDQVQSVDVLPTVLDLLECPGASEFQGTSLMPRVRAFGAAQQEQHAFGETPNLPGTYFVRTGRWKYISPLTISSKAVADALRCSASLDLTGKICGDEQLYDLSRDPEERSNVAGQETGTAGELRAALSAWMEENRRMLARLESSEQGKRSGAGRVSLTDEEKEKLKALGYAE